MKTIAIMLMAVVMLATGCSPKLNKSDPRNVDSAVQECHANAANVVLTRNNAIDNRRFWLSVLRLKESQAVFDCLSSWSAEHLGSRAELVDVFPEGEDAIPQAISRPGNSVRRPVTAHRH